MNLKYFILIMALLLCNKSLVHANDQEQVRTYSLDDKIFHCSRFLSTILFNFCENAYKIVKRETKSLIIEKISPEYLRIETNKQLLAAGRQRRVRRQLADECCSRPCTVGDIIMYCADDAKLVKERPDIFQK